MRTYKKATSTPTMMHKKVTSCEIGIKAGSYLGEKFSFILCIVYILINSFKERRFYLNTKHLSKSVKRKI